MLIQVEPNFISVDFISANLAQYDSPGSVLHQNRLNLKPLKISGNVFQLPPEALPRPSEAVRVFLHSWPV